MTGRPPAESGWKGREPTEALSAEKGAAASTPKFSMWKDVNLKTEDILYTQQDLGRMQGAQQKIMGHCDRSPTSDALRQQPAGDTKPIETL